MLPASDSLQTATVISLIIAALGYAVSMGKLAFKYNGLSVLILCLWGVAAVSVIASEVTFVSLIYFFFFSVFPLTFLLFSSVDATNLLKPLRLIILLLAIGSLIQFYCMPQMLKFGGTHWPLEDNNSLAAILASGALMFIGESLRGGRWTYHHIAAASVLFAGLMTTGGVAVFFGFFLVLGVMTWMAGGRVLRLSSYRPVGFFMVAVAVLMCAMTTSDTSIYHFISKWSGSVDIFVNTGLHEPNRVSGSRLLIWESALGIFKGHIWTGTGIGTFFLYYPEVRSIHDDSAGFTAHNDLVQFAVEMGFLAPLLALIIVGFVVCKTIRKLRDLSNPQDRLNFLVPFAVFGLIMGHSLVNFNMYVLPTLMIVGMMLAIWNGYFPGKEIRAVQTRTIREMLCFGSVMVVLVPLWGCYLSEYYTTKATDALAGGNIQQFSDNLNLADSWGVGQNGRAVLMAAQFSAATNNNQRALTLLDRAQSLNPRLVQIYVERARIWSLEDSAKGVEEARHALEMDEGSLTARMMVFEILEQRGQRDDAYLVLKAGLDGIIKSRNPVPFYQMLATKSLEQGDMETNKTVLLRLNQLQQSK